MFAYLVLLIYLFVCLLKLKFRFYFMIGKRDNDVNTYSNRLIAVILIFFLLSIYFTATSISVIGVVVAVVAFQYLIQMNERQFISFALLVLHFARANIGS